ncbi:MAG: hypothetical protein AAFV01_06355 [Bacteroidota bacterium]
MPFFKRRTQPAPSPASEVRPESLTDAETRARTEALLNDFARLMVETQDAGSVFATVLGNVASKGADVCSFLDQRDVGGFTRDGRIVVDVQYGDTGVDVEHATIGTVGLAWGAFGVAIEKWTRHVSHLAAGTCGECAPRRCPQHRHFVDGPISALTCALTGLLDESHSAEPTRRFLSHQVMGTA